MIILLHTLTHIHILSLCSFTCELAKQGGKSVGQGEGSVVVIFGTVFWLCGGDY